MKIISLKSVLRYDFTFTLVTFLAEMPLSFPNLKVKVEKEKVSIHIMKDKNGPKLLVNRILKTSKVLVQNVSYVF